MTGFEFVAGHIAGDCELSARYSPFRRLGDLAQDIRIELDTSARLRPAARRCAASSSSRSNAGFLAVGISLQALSPATLASLRELRALEDAEWLDHAGLPLTEVLARIVDICVEVLAGKLNGRLAAALEGM